MDGKPRLADPEVAEDSKDFFFAMLKPRYLSFEILTIAYSEKSTRAQASVNCEEDVMMMGLGKMRVKMPRISLWKLVRGRWYWYLDPNAERQTPFGPMKPVSKPGDAPSSPFVMPPGPKPEDLLGLVKADKTEVVLSSPGPSSDTVTVSNGMPGSVKLVLELPRILIPGFEVKLDRADLPANQTARITFQYEPKDGAPELEVMVNVKVEPTGVLIPIRVTFKTPAAPKDKQPR